MTAVIRPIGVHHLHFRDGRVAPLILKVALQEPDIRQIHGKAAVLDEGLQSHVIQMAEAFQHLYISRPFELLSQGIHFIQ